MYISFNVDLNGNLTVERHSGRQEAKPKREFKGSSLLEIPSSYTAIDIETTGLDPYFDEIIEICAIKVRNNTVYDHFSTLIKPSTEIDDFITKLTGITNEMLIDAPPINQVLQNFNDFISDDVLIAHNAHFDINFLYDAQMQILKKPLTNDLVDTLRLARRLFKELESFKLKNLANYFNLNIEPTHRAIDDCNVVVELINKFREYIFVNNIDLSALTTNKNKVSLNAKDISTSNTEFDEKSPIFGKHFVFTGKLAKLDRKEAMQAVVDMGGFCDNGVIKCSNYLVLGNLDYCSSIKDGKSSKIKKAEKLILEGQDLSIISENVFYELFEQ